MARGLLGLRFVSKETIAKILEEAKEMKKILVERRNENILSGKTVVTLFYEPSTRTRVSFEKAAKVLGANTINIETATSSVLKGESLVDTARTIERMGIDLLVLRHSIVGSPQILDRELKVPVVNAGDGINEHPTQALLDMFTMLEKRGRLEGLRVLIVGDIYHSRVARSNIWGLSKMGAEVRVCGPSTLMPSEVGKLGVKVYYKLDEAIRDVDVVMALRIQMERQKSGLFPSIREFTNLYGINKDRLKLAKEDVILMHPGPMNRGIEVDTDSAYCDSSVIEEQVTNGVAIRMALLKLLIRGEILS